MSQQRIAESETTLVGSWEARRGRCAGETTGWWDIDELGTAAGRPRSSVCLVYGTDGQAVADARAHLIAAAPTLLQLVREAHELLSNKPTDLSLRDWRTAAEAALARVESRS